ncbi:hypothetical protein ACFLQN_03480 [Candidatus Aenigmatarchaeota archaeon]
MENRKKYLFYRNQDTLMRMEYFIVSIIVFLVILSILLSMASDVVPTFSTFLDDIQNFLR